MLNRRLRQIIAVLAFAAYWFLSGIASSHALVARDRVETRDWRQFPAIVEIDADATVVAVGDVHGDYERLAHLLKKAGLIDEENADPSDLKWRGGKTILICTGDLIDKGKHSLDVIQCFRTLERKAADEGGKTIVTMGNHEAEFLANPDDDEKAEKFLAELEKQDLDPADVATGKDKKGIGAFLRRLPFAARVNDWFFAHACGVDGRTLRTLKAALADSVDEEGFGADILLAKRGLLEARLKPIPWWERKGDKPKESESRLRGHADALGIKHFVMGHQPGKAHFSDDSRRKAGELIQKFDGLIFLIDVGMSSAIDKSPGAALRIERHGRRQTATVIRADGTEELIWKVTE
jgi:hypothetical protein